MWKPNLNISSTYLKGGAKIKTQLSPLGYATWVSEDDCVVELLLEAGADPNPTDPLTTASPLLAAVWRESTARVKLLLDNGANVQLPALEADDHVITVQSTFLPLWSAIRLFKYPSADVVRNLVEAGARLDLKHNLGCTLLYYALYSQPDMMRILLEFRASLDIGSRDIEGTTALLCEARRNINIYCHQLLLRAGAHVNLRSSTGENP